MALGSWPFWRIYVTATNGSGALDLFEVEFRNLGTDQTGSGTPTSSSAFGGFPVSNAFDNNFSSRFVTSFAGAPHWIQYQFTGPTRVDSVYIHVANEGGDRSPRTFTVECSLNGITWVVAHTVTNEPAWNNSGKSFSFTPPNPPEKGNRIMITPDFWRDP